MNVWVLEVGNTANTPNPPQGLFTSLEKTWESPQ